jgi:uracil-DNA glycosylase family protein
VRHWATLPEAEMIPKLLQNASLRENNMRKANPPSADPFLPAQHSLEALSLAIRDCQGCNLYCNATQAVFGEGPSKARVMFVGEQPGDQEDLQGKPFVGPAGKIWNRALEEAGINRSEVYVTNAVKHFKFEERGKRRIHQKPRGVEVAACRPWLTAEIEQVDPRIIVALGATAALSVGGREFAIQKERGKLMSMAGHRQLLITVHPSFLLRIPESDKPMEFSKFVSDLRMLL